MDEDEPINLGGCQSTHVLLAIPFTAFTVREIPEYLTTLARALTRAFLEPLHAIVVEIIVRDTCVKFEDIVDLCQLDRNLVRGLP